MNTDKKILMVSKMLVCLLFVAALLIAAGESARGDSVVPENKVPRRVESKAVQLTHELEKQGFEVIRGYFKLWTIEDCEYTYGRWRNITATIRLPYVIDTTSVAGRFGPGLAISLGIAESCHDIYRFDPREAIVILRLLHSRVLISQAIRFSRKEFLTQMINIPISRTTIC
jgi:hypothetical protein